MVQDQAKGKFKELLSLFFPILAMTFSNFLYLFIEKLFFSRLSTLTMEAAVNVAYVSQIFQAPCIALAMMALVHVGRWRGAQEFKTIGPGIWQFIWFSLLSMLITFPLSILYGSYYFKNIIISEIAMPYFYFLISFNFLYPLGTALTCLYLGLRKTRLILWATLVFQFVKLTLAYLLIFGWSLIPSFGIMGGAYSTLIAQGGFCLLLFCIFLSPKYAQEYQSRHWKFHPSLFWECIHPGLLRAGNRILNHTSWASMAHLMTAMGGEYLLILSLGGTLFIFLPFLGDAILQAQTSIVSQIIGARNYHLLGNAFRSGTILCIIPIVIFAIPLLLFPSLTFEYLFPNVVMDSGTIHKVFLGVWLSFAFFTFSYIPISYILAYKDMRFSLFMGFVGWINGFLVLYLILEYMNMKADQFWLVMSVMHVLNTIFYLLRMRHLRSKEYYSPSLISR